MKAELKRHRLLIGLCVFIALWPWLMAFLSRVEAGSILAFLVGCGGLVIAAGALVGTVVSCFRQEWSCLSAELVWALATATFVAGSHYREGAARHAWFRIRLSSFKAGIKETNLDALPVDFFSREKAPADGAYSVSVATVRGERVFLIETPSFMTLETTLYSRRLLPRGSKLDGDSLTLVRHDEMGFWYFVGHSRPEPN